MFISALLNGGKYKNSRQDSHRANPHDSQQSKSQAHHVLSIPKLHPVYLPFKTQHRILVPIQSLLEECCLEFGNTWVPDLMEARKWNEAESIELTEWTKRFLKYAKSLPPSAIKPIPGKSLAEVLFGTSTLRHSAVHRLPTSAAGILNMLSAAITFAEALKDSKRAEKVAEIRMQLEASIEEIVQHQNLLERKLTGQFEDIARRRAELDELERSSIEEMLATDKKQRTEVGSAFESILVSSKLVSNPCACSHTPSSDGTKADSKVEENIESSWIGMFLYPNFFCFKSPLFLHLFLHSLEHELKPLAGINEAEAYDQSPLGEEKPHQGENLEKNDRPHYHDNIGGSVEDELEVSELTLSTFRSKKQKKKDEKQKKKGKKAAASGWGTSATEESLMLVDEASALGDTSPAPLGVTHHRAWESLRHGAWNCCTTSSITAEPHNAIEEAIPTEEPCFAALPEVPSADEAYVITPEEEPLPEDAIPAEEAISKEDLMEMEKAAPEPTLEASGGEPITEGFDSVKEHTLNQCIDVTYDLDDPYEPMPEPDIAPMHIDPAEDGEFLIPPPRPALCAGCDKSDSHSPPPSAPSSIVTSVFEAEAPEAPTIDGHTITLKILNGSKVLRSIIFIKACTRTAILNEAKAYCAKCAQDDKSLERLLPKSWDLALVSLKMYGYNMDLSTYEVENLFSLVQTVEKTGIPRFTLRMFES